MRKTFKKTFYCIASFIFLIENILFNFNLYKVSAKIVPDGNPIDAVDSFRITHVYDKNLIYIEWQKGNPDISGTGELLSGEQIRFFLDWSVKNGTAVNPGDYFTFTFPDVFNHSWIENKNDIAITHPDDGSVMAKYSIVEKNGKKELIIIFTEGIIGREDIYGSYELAMFIGEFETRKETSLTFEINGTGTTISDGIIGNPPLPPPYIERGDAKWGGRAELDRKIDGHYYFKWTVWINFKFNIIDNFSISDIIPANSPHVFITPQTAAQLGITIPDTLSHLYHMSIREYIGADSIQENRYNKFQEQLNNIDGWYENYMAQYTVDTATLTFTPDPLNGVDSGGGINLTGLTFSPDGKEFSANLGRVTRPILIDFYTITTQPFSDNAFYDDNTASMMKNTVTLNGSETKSDRIHSIWVNESASIGGIYGNFTVTVKKADENNRGLAGVSFSLYTTPDCAGPADRSSQSQDDGTVAFGNLKPGIYYIKETIAPDGYILSDMIYKVELTNNGFTISAPDGSPVTEIVNYKRPVSIPKPRIQIIKVDSDGNSLNGAIFKLTKSDDKEIELTLDPSDNSKYISEELEAGTYIIEETASPDGYQPIDGIIEEFTVEEDGIINGENIISTSDSSVYELIVANTPLPDEPDEEPYNPYIPPVITEPITEMEIKEEDNTVPETTEITTENNTATESITEEEITSESIPLTDKDIITVPGLPDGYWIEQIAEDLYEVYDDEGIPLGGIEVPEGELIENIEYEKILDILIPQTVIDFPNEPASDPQTPDVLPENNPKTSDVLIVTLILMSFSLIFLSFIAKKKI